MELKNLDYLFAPRSIAFVGATRAKIKWGFIVFNNLLSGGYAGAVYPVNPGYEEVSGLKCYRSVRDIPGEVDLAVITVPAQHVPSIIDDCSAKRVKAALVITAGFSELGPRGVALQEEMVGRADAAGMVLAGPNGQGVCCPESNLYCWMPLFFPPPGKVAAVCQSGNILNMIIGELLDAGLGISKAVSSGNEAMLKTEDYFAYLADDPATEVMVAYIEGIDDGRRFLEISAEASRKKPVVILKGGRTAAGKKAATSHTGALAVEAPLFESACRQAGLVVTDSIRQAGITAGSFVNRPLPGGRRVAIVTGGGGLGVIAADSCVDAGLEIASLSDGTLDEIGRFLPEYWVRGNPVDLVAGLDLSVVKPILETLLTCGEVDSVVFIFVESQRNKTVRIMDPSAQAMEMGAIWDMVTRKLAEYIHDLYDVAEKEGVPLFVISNLEEVSEEKGLLGGGGRPMVYLDVESASRAIAAMADRHAFLRRDGAAT